MIERGAPSPAHSVVKRIVDLSVASIVLVVTLPIIAAAAAAVWFSIGPPALFRQRRAGYLGQPFTLLKFRTMRGPSITGREALDDADRLTPVGTILRRLSVDELPQLINVLRGEMSLVGPRPLLLDYLPLYSSEQRRRHDVKPGMTGWTQVSGRNMLDWSQKFELDVWYVDNWSIWLDLRILLLTARQVVSGRGVSSAGHVTMTRFNGDHHRRDDERPA